MINVIPLFLILFCLFSAAAAAQQNVTLFFGNPALTFLPGWDISTAQASRSQFLVFDDIDDALEIVFPRFATRVTYTGLKRTGGSQYGVCLNCNDSGSIRVFDGHDDNLERDSLAVPTTIFQISLPPNRQNTLSLINLPDNRFGGDSELTFVSLTVLVDDGSVSSSSSLSTTSRSTSATSVRTSSTSSSIFSSSGTTSVSETTSSQNPSTSASGSPSATTSAENAASNGTRNSIIAIIAIFVVLGIASLLVGLSFYLRRRRARRRSRMAQYSFNAPSAQSGARDSPTRFPSIRSPSPYAPRVSLMDSSPGPLAAAGRSRPATRLPDPYPYPFSQQPVAGPLTPNRRRLNSR
ncbi:hypothetical protein VNI00_001401 [Paramarasmius palmivorus]|uniref:Uncharacterized protein n=1 Tax=Paramarasmius palmivorus TaxID=297713 RepID=A0AAW0E4B1_9AGAR